MELNTFSICARCDKTNQIGIAIATAVPLVRKLCPFITPKIGAVITQSYHSETLALEALALLRKGLSPEKILKTILTNDPKKDFRQVGIIDWSGNTAAWTGSKCKSQSLHLTDKNISVQGNLLKGKNVINVMFQNFQNNKSLTLKERLMLSLEAGSFMGGDKRGGKNQSASLLIYSHEKLPIIDISVDSSDQPVLQLRKILNKSEVTK